MKSKITDMTTGNPSKHILLFAFPMLIGNVFQQAYNFADSVIVGRFVGSDAFAAVGATASITFLFFALCNGIGGGGGIIVSQFYGARDNENVKKSIVNTGLLMLFVPALFGLLGFLSAPELLKLLETPDEILSDAIVYVRYMCVGLLFVSLYNYVASMLRALGDAKTPLYFLILSALLNIFLDILFVCGFSLGIRGAACATIASQFVSVLCCGAYARKTNHFFRFQKRDMRVSLRLSYRIIRLGVPMSVQFGLIAISSMAVQRIVNSFGSVAVSAFTATNRIEQLIHQPYTTLGASLSTYSGQNYGAGKTDRVSAGYKSGTLIMLSLTVVLTVVMQLFGKAIVSLFVSDSDIIALGALGLRITSLFYPALGMIYVIRGVLTGIGDALFALMNGVVEVIGRFTIPLFLTAFLGFGASGVWLASGVVWTLSAVTAWLRHFAYFRRKILTDGKSPKQETPPGNIPRIS